VSHAILSGNVGSLRVGQPRHNVCQKNSPMCVAFSKRAMEKCMQLIFILALNDCEAQRINHRLRTARHLAALLNETVFEAPQ
jgi:hypothetical protein